MYFVKYDDETETTNIFLAELQISIRTQ